MDFFDHKVVIITGASEGIGARLTEILRRRGAQLSIAARNEQKLREIGGNDSLIIAGDLTTETVRAALIAKTVERRGRIDILINNAGRGSYYSVSATPMDEARAVFDLNFFVPLALTQLATPYLKQTRGSVVNVNSIAGLIALPWLSVYSASKFALAGITASQRAEFRSSGVHVMGVFPGYVDTEFQAHAPGPRPPERLAWGRRFAIPAGQCAQAIVTGIERRSRMVVTPRAGWLLVWLNRFFPALVESRLERV
jgi:short-subunit dehydrogenase